MKKSFDEIRQMIEDYYAKPGNGAGGSLHIVLDDYNLSDSSIEFCINWAHEHGDPDGILLGHELSRLSFAERCQLLDLEVDEDQYGC